MKSTDRILAQRYAKAFDALSGNTEQAQARFDALLTATEVLKQAQTLMADPAVASAEKVAFAQEVLQEDKTVACFISVLLEAKRYYLLEECLRQVYDLLDQRLGIVRAKVKTAFALTEEQKKKVEEALSSFTGKKARAQYETDAALLGGICAQVGDVLIDGTLKRRFEKLREELTK